MNINIWKRLILENSFCSSISWIFPQVVTYIHANEYIKKVFMYNKKNTFHLDFKENK